MRLVNENCQEVEETWLHVKQLAALLVKTCSKENIKKRSNNYLKVIALLLKYPEILFKLE